MLDGCALGGGEGVVRQAHGEEAAACSGESVGDVIGLLGCCCHDGGIDGRCWWYARRRDIVLYEGQCTVEHSKNLGAICSHSWHL